MPDFTFTSPSGKTYTVTAPEGATSEQAFGVLQTQMGNQVAQARESTSAQPATGKIKSPEPMGGAESFMTGLGDVPIGVKQTMSHITGTPQEAGKIDLAVKQREDEIARRGGGGITRGLGAATAAAPAMALGGAGMFGAIPAIAGGAAGGALAEAATPTVAERGQDYWDTKGPALATGAAIGGGLTAGGRLLGTIFGPTLGPDAKTLIESGVKLTPGQMQGGILRRAEEAMKSIPILGSFIRGAEGRGILAFNRAVINQALEPIGQTIPKGLSGRTAIAAAYDHLNNAYGSVLPNLRFTLSGQTAQTLDQALRDGMRVLPEAQAEQLKNVIDSKVMDLFRRQSTPYGGGLVVTGPELKKVDSELRVIADRYRSSPLGSERDFAEKVGDFRDALRQTLIQQNPNNADLLKRIDYAYAMMSRAGQSSTRRAGSGGVFTPSDLINVVKQQDTSAQKARFRRGDALMQDYAEIAQRILPGHVPDSGTPERILWDAAVLGMGGGHFGFEQILKGAGAMSLGLPYTRPGMGIANWQAQSGPARDALGRIIRGAASPAAIGSESILRRPEYGGPYE